MLSLIGSCFINTTTAQHFAIKKYTVNDGLADSYILAICQDSQGFLWVGTVNGLSRFDGKEFINYGYAEGLPNLIVDVVYEDHLKRLWAGTRKGIVEIKGGSAVAYPVDDGQVIHLYSTYRKVPITSCGRLPIKGCTGSTTTNGRSFGYTQD